MASRPSQLKVRREAAGLTQEELAARVGVSASQIWRIEAGKSGTTQAVWNMIDVVLGDRPSATTGAAA